METPVDEISAARVALSCHRTRLFIWQKQQLFISSEAGTVEAISLSLWHICGCTICTCADRFGWRTLWHTSCTRLEESHSGSSLPSPLPHWPLWSTTACDWCASATSSHVWRCQSWVFPKVVQHPPGDQQRHLANAFTHEVLVFWIFKTFFWVGYRTRWDWPERVNPNLGKTFKVDKQTTLLSTPPPHITIRDGRRWPCCRSLDLICAVRGRSETHHDVLSLLFKIKDVSMGLKKRFDCDHSYRFSPYNGFTQLLHLAYVHLLGDVNMDITVHHWIHTGRSRSERCGL